MSKMELVDSALSQNRGWNISKAFLKSFKEKVLNLQANLGEISDAFMLYLVIKLKQNACFLTRTLRISYWMQISILFHGQMAGPEISPIISIHAIKGLEILLYRIP